NSGKVFLAGPYKEAPLSLEVVVPAVAGAYDLGNVVTRVATFVDPTTAQVKTVSDPITQIISGVPLPVRVTLFDFDRPGINRTPTNGDPKSMGAKISGDQGTKNAEL